MYVSYHTFLIGGEWGGNMLCISVPPTQYRVGAYCTPGAVLLTGKTEEKTHEGLTA